MENPQDRSYFPDFRSWEGMRKFLDRIRPPEEFILVFTAMFIGVGTGLWAVGFVWILRKIGELNAQISEYSGEIIGTLLVMTLAGLIVGFIADRWAPEIAGSGVPDVMESGAIHGGRMRPQTAFFKTIAASITIGAGGSAGREGPIVQVGAALGSWLGQILHFSSRRIRTLLACGASAGVAAMFNAPIAGAIFALEVVLGRFTNRYFGAVVISSVSAAIVARIFLGDQPAFNVPAYALTNLGEIPIYLILGLISGVVAVIFIKFLYRSEVFFEKINIGKAPKAALGMLLTAGIALLLPGRDVLGSGLDLIGATIAVDFDLPLRVMLLMLILKMAATAATLGSGNSGGVFAPSLFIGAVLGGIVGQIAHGIWPEVVVHPGAYAIVGMASVFSGAARAPITAVLIIFEMSNDYRLILPLMMATVLSTLLAEILFTESIYTQKLKLKGVTLTRGRDVDVLQSVTVGEVMTDDFASVRCNATLAELSHIFTSTQHHGLLVLDEKDTFWGVVTIGDFNRAITKQAPLTAQVRQFGVSHPHVLVAYPDESMGDALLRLGSRGIGRLPVLSREDPGKLIGVIWRENITRAYRIAISRRVEIEHRSEQAKLENFDGAEFVEIRIAQGDYAAGMTVGDLRVPRECVLISVQRNGKMIIPRGQTVIEEGDLITAFTESEDIEALNRCFNPIEKDS